MDCLHDNINPVVLSHSKVSHELIESLFKRLTVRVKVIHNVSFDNKGHKVLHILMKLLISLPNFCLLLHEFV